MYRFLLSWTLVLPTLLACGGAAPARAQESSATAARPPEDLSSWKRVQNLPAHTKVHITADHGGSTCRIFAVSEDSLTCASGLGGKSAGKVIQRTAVRHIKLTRYGLSTAAGFGIGAGVGAAVGAGATRQGDWFRDLGIAVFTVIGALPGAAIGGGTDFTRGPTVYLRP